VLNTQRSDNSITIVLKAAHLQTLVNAERTSILKAAHLQTLVNAERTSITMMVKEAITTYYASSSAKETV
jgi:hypothetical protein